ncbi:MAG: DUF1622 domain-containing protein [Cyanobacteriota bacterium]|nr:DUF1622 domain-containing protein [Cyanobacteriota bacterium]
MNRATLFLWSFGFWELFAQVCGAGVVVTSVAFSLRCLFPLPNLEQARLVATEGMILGLSLMTCVAVLKTLEAQTFSQIAYLACLFILRVSLKKFLAWEKRLWHSESQWDP